MASNEVRLPQRFSRWCTEMLGGILVLEKNTGTLTFIFILLTFLYSLFLIMYRESFCWVHFFRLRHSFYCICSFHDRELEIVLTSGLSQITLNQVLKMKSHQLISKQIFYGTLTTSAITDYYAESSVFQISLETLFCNFSIC